jgi:hypothetical protein
MEYFVVANSKAAPFVSDTSNKFQKGRSPHEALGLFIEAYSHPSGLFSAAVYESSDDFHKGKKPLATFYPPQ